MKEDGAEFFTENRNNLYTDTTEELDFDELMAEFNGMIEKIVGSATDEEMETYWQPRITSITDKHLGRGHKVGNMAREQVEALSLIVDDMKELVATAKK